MNPTMFEDLDQGGGAQGDSRKPFFAIDISSESEVHQWCKDVLTQLKTNSWMRLEKVKNNYFRYKGIQYINQVYMPRDVPETRKRYMPQMVIPLIRDAIDEKIARIMESKPKVTVLPHDDEERDKVDAKIAKRFLSHVDYQEKMQDRLRSWLRGAEVAGESFAWPRWNPDKGDTVPEAAAMGRPDIKYGDIEVKLFSPFNFYHEEIPSRDWKDVNYCFFVEYEYTEGLKRDYPGKSGDIKSETVGSVYFDFESMEEKPLQGFTRKITFFYKATKYLPTGFQCVFTNDALLKMGPLPEEYEGKLPAERLVMAQNEEELHGESPIEFVRGMAAQVNNAQNLIIKQLMLTAHPKWFVTEGSVEDQQLNNDTGIVKIKKGGDKPLLAQANPVSPQLMEHVAQLKKDFYDFAKSNSVVRGEPPSGVTAFVALQYVSEAESRRLSTEVSYFSEGVVSLYQRILKIAAVKYQPGEQRTMMIMGKDNRFNRMKYDPASLKKDFSVVIQNSSGLPDSKAARTQAILDTASQFPNLFPPEQIVEMLDFGQAEKFYDIGGLAARAAEEENEMMLDGSGSVEPAEHEDLITHWRVHTASIQDIGFKTKLDPQIQQMVLDHLMATEMLMVERAMKSPAFAQQLLTIPQFPMLFETVPLVPPPTPPMPEEEGKAPSKDKKPDMTDATAAGTPRAQPASPAPKAQQSL